MAFYISDLGKMHQSQSSLYLPFQKSSEIPEKPVSGVFWKFLLRHYQIKYGFQIYPETQIGEGFYLAIGALVINPKAKIGKNCNIAQGVTIGQQNRGKNEGFPVMEMKYGLARMPLLLEV
jgi:NDP-sugar pyrophosphorylase family protein